MVRGGFVVEVVCDQNSAAKRCRGGTRRDGVSWVRGIARNAAKQVSILFQVTLQGHLIRAEQQYVCP